MNLLMIAPLCDSRGVIRYFIGAQVDVSGLVKDCTDLESLRRLVTENENEHEPESDDKDLDEEQASSDVKRNFQQLSEMLTMEELEMVRIRGGRMREYHTEEITDNDSKSKNWNKPRLLIHSTNPNGQNCPGPMGRPSGKLAGIYEQYLLVRPYPGLRILFASPALRMPGILQSPFMDKIGGSGRVKEQLVCALADGRGVTAKVRWLTSKSDQEGRNRWIHCTPLIGSNGAVGVWMIVIADDEDPTSRKTKRAPPVDPNLGRTMPFDGEDDNLSLKDFARINGARDVKRDSPRGDQTPLKRRDSLNGSIGGGSRSINGEALNGSPYSLRFD